MRDLVHESNVLESSGECHFCAWMRTVSWTCVLECLQLLWCHSLSCPLTSIVRRNPTTLLFYHFIHCEFCYMEGSYRASNLRKLRGVANAAVKPSLSLMWTGSKSRYIWHYQKCPIVLSWIRGQRSIHFWLGLFCVHLDLYVLLAYGHKSLPNSQKFLCLEPSF